MEKNHRFALSFMLTSFFFLMGGIWGVKKFIEAPKKHQQENISNFNFSKIKRTIKDKDITRVKKKQKKIKNKMKALKPMLTGNLSGPSFGMDLAELANLDLDSELLSTDEEIIMDENSVDSKPKIVSITKIDFPEKALVLEISKGMVEVRLLIDKYGNVGRTQVIDATPKGVFEESTLLALQSWKFEPATYRGKNVAIWAKQVVKFGE